MADALTRKIRQALEPDDRIEFVLIFGSMARDEVRENSDVDIAIGIARDVANPLQLRLDVMARLSDLHSRVDVIIADTAPPALAYRIARDGLTVFSRRPTSITNFKARAYSMYPDWQRIMRVQEKAMLDRIDGGTYGR